MQSMMAVIEGICKIPTKSEIQTVLKNVGSYGWGVLREGGDSPEEILENITESFRLSHEIISNELDIFLRKSGFEIQIAGDASWEYVKVAGKSNCIILTLSLFAEKALIESAVQLSMHWLRDDKHFAKALYGTWFEEIISALGWKINDCLAFNAEPKIMFDDFTQEVRKREEDIVSELL
jgi:hypothetical protein